MDGYFREQRTCYEDPDGPRDSGRTQEFADWSEFPLCPLFRLNAFVKEMLCSQAEDEAEHDQYQPRGSVVKGGMWLVRSDVREE